MIESKLAFFQVKIEGLLRYSSELREPYFSPSPEVFNTVNVIVSISKFIVFVKDSIVFLKPEINKTIVCFEAVGVHC